MTRLRERIRTSLGPEAAFAYVADFANSMHWDPGVATSRRIDAGQVGVGVVGRVLGDGHPDVTAVQSQFDGGVLECAGDLGGQVG